MTEQRQSVRDPFLFRFMEDDTVQEKPANATNPKEEEPSPEPTKKGPWGE